MSYQYPQQPQGPGDPQSPFGGGGGYPQQPGGYGGGGYPPPGGGGFPPPGGSGGGNRGLWITLGILAVVLLVGLVAAGAFFLVNNDDGDSEDSDKEKTSQATSESESDPATGLPTNPTDIPTDPNEFPTDFPSDSVPPGFPTECLSALEDESALEECLKLITESPQTG